MYRSIQLQLRDGKINGPFHLGSVGSCSQLGTITKVKRKRREFSKGNVEIDFVSVRDVSRETFALNEFPAWESHIISFWQGGCSPGCVQNDVKKHKELPMTHWIGLRILISSVHVLCLFKTSCLLTARCIKWHCSIWRSRCPRCDCKLPSQWWHFIHALRLGLYPGTCSHWLWDLDKSLNLDKFNFWICKIRSVTLIT